MPLEIKDQIGKSIKLERSPQRIISVVPSQTELLFDLGLDEEIIGVTKFCVRPKDKCTSKPGIGGTKHLHLDKIRSLSPDLIIANKEENTKEQIEKLSEEFPVWTSDIVSLEDSLSMIRSIGMLVNRENEAHELLEKISMGLKDVNQTMPPLNILYLIWYNPLMAAGKGTFINTLLEHCGFQNAVKDDRYPEIDHDNLVKADVVMLSSEPFPFKEKHLKEMKAKAPKTKFVFVDGEIFSWYGSRLLHFPGYITSISKDLTSSQK